jgi:RNA polymerase sigma-70 factor, ECF subfamily
LKLDSLDAVRENYQDLYRFVYRMSGNRETAEDIVQEAFLRLSRNEPDLPDAVAVRRWLFVTARNLCISQYRTASRVFHTPLDEEYGLEAHCQSAPEAVLEEERTQLVQSAVQSLPSALREVVILREFENMTYLDIATMAGCPVGTVRSRLAKARDFLKDKLQPLLEAK